jgi:hypothetical protein
VVTFSSGDKNYFAALLAAGVCSYAWHKGFPELAVGLVVMLLVIIFGKLGAGD